MSDHETTLRGIAQHGTTGAIYDPSPAEHAACLAGADALRRGTWQPIETASRKCVDGTSYLVVSPDYGIVTRTFQVKGTYRGFNWMADEYTADPTHWMPLPDAPKEVARG